MEKPSLLHYLKEIQARSLIKTIGMKKFIIYIFLMLPVITNAQDTKIGVRAGLNYSWFTGAKEVGETFSASNGFHFGINYSYYFNQFFGLRAEILYNQRGNTQNYQGDGYYIMRRGLDRIVDFGTVEDFKLDDSNAYLSLPISASIQVTPKFEMYGGISFDFLVSPSGTGVLDYTSNVDIEGEYQVFFTQSFDNSYYSDVAGGLPDFSSGTIAMIVDGDRLDIPQISAAYYLLDEKDGNKYKWYDFSVHLGTNYFLNRGFFVGANLNYGLIDLTRNEMDISIREINNSDNFTDDSYIRRDDSDHQLSIHVSMGFRF